MYSAVGAYLALLITPLIIGRAAAETNDKIPDGSGSYSGSVDTGAMPRMREEGLDPAHTQEQQPADSRSQPPADAQSASDATGGQQLDMASVERIRLRAWGYAEYSGEYIVDSDATISLPGIGRIHVGGVTPAALETMLSEKLSLFARRPVALAVEVAKFRPYYIVGQISQPGAAEWRPGLNVIQAIALAGGVVRVGSDADQAADGSGNSSRALSIQQGKTQLKFAMAQLARYKAEKEGADSVEADSGLAAVLEDAQANGQTSLKVFMEHQNAVLNEQRASLKTQLEGLENERVSASHELEATLAQQKAIEDQLTASSAILADVEDLKEKKIVANARYLQQRSEHMSYVVRSAELRALVERARARIATVERQETMLKQERQALLNDRIETLEREVAQLQSSLGSYAPVGTSTTAVQRASKVITYHVARRGDSGVRVIAANVLADVLPGDVVIVSGEDKPDQLATDTSKPKNQDVGQASPSEGLDRVLEASAVSRPAGGMMGAQRYGARFSGAE